MNLALKEGKVSLIINLGGGLLDTGIKTKDGKFNDDEWHHVVVTRIARKVIKWFSLVQKYIEKLIILKFRIVL